VSAFEPLGLASRTVLFAAVLTVVGSAAFRWLVLERRARGGALESAASGRAAAVGMVATWFVLLAAAARLFVQLRDIADPELALGPQARALLLGTTWGKAFIGLVVAALMACAGFVAARRGIRAGWLVAGIAALALACTPAFSGHAIGSERLTGLAVTADALHVLAAGSWLGGVVALASVIRLPRRHGEPERAGELVRDFSPVALCAAAVVAVTGVTGGWLHVGPPRDALTHGYGRALAAKALTVGMVALLGAFNWRRAGPRLLREHDERPIARSITAELVAALLVVLATSILVVTPPHGDE
jgi:putative copper export protein